MALTIVTNAASLNAQRNLNRTQGMLNTSLGRLSSGLRINRAGDDAAGLAISENLKAQIRSLGQAERNANDGVSLLQVAEGSMNEISGMLTRMRELTMEAATDTVGSTERGFLDQEFQALTTEIDRISDVTEFNGTKLIDGTATGIEFQVGFRNTASDRIAASLQDMHSTALGTGGGGPALGAQSIATKTGAQGALAVIDASITDTSAGRADVGALENRLQVTISNLASARQNTTEANSRIRDTDVAEESANMTRQNVLLQAGVSVLAQANQVPSMALTLLR